jgi:hypothetical protein
VGPESRWRRDKAGVGGDGGVKSDEHEEEEDTHVTGSGLGRARPVTW